MSQDLLSSFLEDSTDKSIPSTHTTITSADGELHNPWASENSSAWPNLSNTASKPTIEDDDDFGDFEDASAPAPTATTKTQSNFSQPRADDQGSTKPKAKKERTSPPVASQPKAPAKDESIGQHPFAGRMDLLFEAGDDEYDAGVDELGDLATNPEAAMAYSKRIIAEQEAAASNPWRSEPDAHDNVQYGRSSRANVQPQTTKSAKNAPKDPNVLFDADNVSEDDDDLKEFESGDESDDRTAWQTQSKRPAAAQSMPVIDLLGLDDDFSRTAIEDASGWTSASFSPTTQGRVDHTQPDPLSKQYSEPHNDLWDDFETTTPVDTPSESIMPAPEELIPQSQTVTANSKKSSETQLPPTNIPPPSVLISLFPSIISEADDALFNAMSRLDLKQRQMLLGHPASHQFLKGYLAHVIVMARIIAGRKLRWKRDQHLTQSMRIGPAAAGGKSGMKLAGLDKAESAKEDREVVDGVRLWRSQVGKLRTAVTAASAVLTGAKLPPVPEITGQMPIKALKPTEGGIAAPHACALCGLKREERVGKVDMEVDDSFGEWWVQGTNMHLSCRDFWDEFEKKLKSR